MKQREELENSLSALALGASSATETAQLASHLKRGNAKQHKELAKLQRVNRALARAPAASEPPAAVKERVLQSLENLQNASAPGSGFAFVHEAEGEWQSLAPGVAFKNLFNHKATGATTMLVRMAAGSCVPPHQHEDIEELYVLEGDCYCIGECLRVGDYHRAESKSTHGVTFTEHGCLMIVHTTRPAAVQS